MMNSTIEVTGAEWKRLHDLIQELRQENAELINRNEDLELALENMEGWHP